MLSSLSCDTDVHAFDSNSPPGTYLKTFCPASCNHCGANATHANASDTSRRKRRKLKLNTFVHPSFTVLSNIKWADVHRKLGALQARHGRQLEGFTVDKEARNWAYETWLSTSKLSQRADQSSWDACKKGFQGEKQFTW